MKKIIVSFSTLAVSALFFVVACKPKTTVAPAADKEFQSSIEISHALYAFIDAEQIVSFVGEQDQTPKFYTPSSSNSGDISVTSIPPGQNTGTLTSQAGIFSIAFQPLSGSSSTVCLCADGRKRAGTVGVHFTVNKNDVPSPIQPDIVTENSIYFRRYGFGALLSFSQYYVDDYSIVTTNADFVEDGQNVTIKNNLTSSVYSVAASNLSWDIKGNFKVKKGSDSTLCHINITKVLLSSNNPSVFPPPSGGNGTDAPIKWGWINPKNPNDGVKVGYYGTVSGFTSGHVPFNYEIKKEQMVIRDFACYPDQISGITVSQSGSVTAQKEEYHPFVNGIASFTTGDLYPRQIYYGGSENSGEAQCDNSGAVLIKGISYPIDFLK